jgi:integrase
MPRKRQGVSLCGPYRHRAKWRVLRRAPGEADQWVSYDSEEEARADIARARRALEATRVSQAIDAYVASMKARGCAEESLTFARNRLRALATDADEAVDAIRPARARAMLDQVAGSVATRRETLKLARRWWRWLVEQGWARGMPFDGLRVEGVRNRGKAQLTGQEAARLTEYCLEVGGRGPIAVLVALAMGMRRNEVTGIVGRDVDVGGTILWVRGTKTANARRRLEVPSFLAPILVELAKQAGPLGPIFGVTHRDWLRKQVLQACAAAGVPAVCPHGLRGTFATLATSAGAAAHLVAQALGQGGTAVTERHYIRQEATRAVASGRVLSVIAGGRSGEQAAPDPLPAAARCSKS